ncbi:MAG: hypothetical protein DGJ47_000016 [Rickettsiaceae bacterium]
MSLKKITFALVGTLFTFATFTLLKNNNAIGAKQDGKVFEDWSVACSMQTINKKKAQLCVLKQSVNLKKEEKNEIIAEYEIGYYGDKKELKIIQTLPLNIRLDAGTSIVSADKAVTSGKFIVCTKQGCQAISNLSDENLKIILQNDHSKIVFMSIYGKQIATPFSSKGLGAALSYIK